MKRIVVCIFILALTTWNVKGQDDFAPINTGTANFLAITPDARSAGMGGAGVALPGNNNAIFYNGATTLINNQTGGVAYTFTPYMRDYETGHSLNSIGSFYKINSRNVILAGFRYYNYPKIEVIEDGEKSNMNFRPKEWVIDLGYAREIIPNLAASATFKLIHSDMGTIGGAKSANAIAFDLGAIYQRSFNFLNGASWTAGLQVSNLGSKIKYLNSKESLPALAKAGGSIDISFNRLHRLVAAADLGYRLAPSDVQSMQLSTGVEYILIEHFKLRGGYHYGNKDKGDTSYATAGLGASYCGAQLDFSWLFAEKDSPLGNTFWGSLGYSF